MGLKNALAVCLISLFSATLVVLIARAVESQTAARLEPQLASIAAELRALRSQGGLAAAPAAANSETLGNGLIVYYFHGNTRCPTCQAIESQARDTVQTHFASQLGSGGITWRLVNYDDAAAKPLATQFDVQMPVVVLARMKDGQVETWRRLDKVWALVGDRPAFTQYVRTEIERMLASDQGAKPASTETAGPKIPTPDAESATSKGPLAIPVPQ